MSVLADPGSYLEGFVKEGFHALRQTSDQPERVPQNVQTQNQNVHLLEELQSKDTGSCLCGRRRPGVAST